MTSGSTAEAADYGCFCSSIIAAGTHQASSLKVAEAAKVIENTQRDLNIALVNELAIIFRRMDVGLDVLEAAGTKGIFCRFGLGWWAATALVSILPHHKAEQLGYNAGGIGGPAHQ